MPPRNRGHFKNMNTIEIMKKLLSKHFTNKKKFIKYLNFLCKIKG